MSTAGSQSPLCITGWGAVSPAGWSSAALADAVLAGEPLPVTRESRAEGAPQRAFRKVPPMPATPDWMKQPRFRRTTAAARHAVHAAVQALSPEHLERAKAGQLRVGTIFCTMSGCVQFSRRFYAEVLANPQLASPILFPETVYNAPASHISSLLGSPEMNYTLVGDSAQFVVALDLAGQWLDDHLVDACLVVAAEELDWISDEALLLFDSQGIAAEGAAAVLVEQASASAPGSITLKAVTEAYTYNQHLSRADAARKLKEALSPHAMASALLCDGPSHSACPDLWTDWAGSRSQAGPVVGEGFAITSGWQTVLACEHLHRRLATQALISAVGLTQQAAGAVLKVS